MKIVKRLLIIIVIGLGIYFFFKDPQMFERETGNLSQKELLLEKKEQIQSAVESSLEIDLANWIGKSSEELLKEAGEPDRKDLSSYGYVSYIYMNEYNHYVIFGVKNDEIVTVFGTGKQLDLGVFTIGDTYEEVTGHISFEEEIGFRRGTSSYKLQFSNEDLKYRPIVQIDQNEFLQFYFDVSEDNLIAVRLLDSETLLAHEIYDVTYRGKLPEIEPLTNEEQSLVSKNEAIQTIELTNVIRDFYGKYPLDMSEDIQKVAFLHSKDMVVNNYFSHDSLSSKTLANRLADNDVIYTMAGENIASNYTDPLATVIGWLNSEGHRESLLNDEFTHIGVGVYEKNYTQNFIKK